MPRSATSTSTDSEPRTNAVERVTLQNGGPCVHGNIDESGIQLSSRRCRGEDPVAGKGKADLAPRRRSQPRRVDRFPTRHHLRLQPEVFELAQGQGRQAVAAALVAREHCLVDDDDRPSGPGQHRRRRRAGRAGTNHDDVGNGRNAHPGTLGVDQAETAGRLQERLPHRQLGDGCRTDVGQQRIQRVAGALGERHVAMTGNRGSRHGRSGRPPL